MATPISAYKTTNSIAANGPAYITGVNYTIDAHGFTTGTVTGGCHMVGWNPATENISMFIDTCENGVELSLEYSPERDINAFEALCLMMLVTGLSQESMGAPENALKFIRKNNLERHFKFTQP